MARSRGIRGRSGRKKINTGGFDLQLTSMMDILIIVVVFLLKTYSVSTNSFTSVKGIQLPYTATQETPPDGLQVIITPEAITFENERILDFVQSASAVGTTEEPSYAFNPTDLDEGGRRIVPLFDALTKAREKSELLRVQSSARDEQGNPLPFEGVLAIQCDKRVNYDTVRRIMYTAATAGFRVFRFLAMKKEI